MTRKFLLLSVLLVFMAFFSNAVLALPLANIANDGYEDRADDSVYDYWANTGELMFVIQGNDNEEGIATLEESVENWLINEEIITESDRSFFTLTNTNQYLTLYGGESETNLGTGFGETVPDGSLSGTYKVDTNYLTGISFYSVKASNYYAFYYEDPQESYGSWSSYDIWLEKGNGDGPALSHWNGFNGTPPNPVPEPATLLLLGLGLVGITGASRKKFFKKS